MHAGCRGRSQSNMPDDAPPPPNPTLTANIYTHLMRERFEEGREKLENYMREKQNPDPRHTIKSPNSRSADTQPSVGHANHSGHSSPGWRPSPIAIRSAVSLRTDRFASTRCSVRRSIRSSWARSTMLCSRRWAHRRSSTISGAASYQPPHCGRADSATVDRGPNGGWLDRAQ